MPLSVSWLLTCLPPQHMYVMVVSLMHVSVCLCVYAVDGDVEMDNVDDEQDYSFTEYFQ